MLVFAVAYSSCALNLLLRDSGFSPSLTSQENTPSTFLQESGQSPSPIDATFVVRSELTGLRSDEGQELAWRNNPDILESRRKMSDISGHNVVRPRLQRTLNHFVIIGSRVTLSLSSELRA
jgi:hypothetical protein